MPKLQPGSTSLILKGTHDEVGYQPVYILQTDVRKELHSSAGVAQVWPALSIHHL